MADMDGDSDMDLLVGDADGFVTYYVRDEEGDLSSEGHISVDDEDIMVWRAAPHVTDWDLDGDLDLLVGRYWGNITLYRNGGDAEEFVFSDNGFLTAGNDTINLQRDSTPAFADLDGDGKRDLIAGNTWGEIWFFPNISETDEPAFGEGVQLEDENGQILLEANTRVEVADWDGDGDMDILSGSQNPELILFINPSENNVSPSRNTSPTTFNIISNYPEPFNHSTKLSFQCYEPGLTWIDVTDLSGRFISRNLIYVQGAKQFHSIEMSGYPSGRYMVSIRSDKSIASKIITLVK